MTQYTYRCTMKNGQVFMRQMKGFNRMKAAAAMRQDKAIFTGCTDWKLIKID